MPTVSTELLSNANLGEQKGAHRKTYTETSITRTTFESLTPKQLKLDTNNETTLRQTLNKVSAHSPLHRSIVFLLL